MSIVQFAGLLLELVSLEFSGMGWYGMGGLGGVHILGGFVWVDLDMGVVRLPSCLYMGGEGGGGGSGLIEVKSRI